MIMESMIKIDGLTHRFGETLALDGVSLEVGSGEVRTGGCHRGALPGGSRTAPGRAVPGPAAGKALDNAAGFAAGSALLPQPGLSLVGDPIAHRTGPGDPLRSPQRTHTNAEARTGTLGNAGANDVGAPL